MVEEPVKNFTQPIPKSRVVLYLSLAVSGCVFDLATKHWVFSRSDMFLGNEWWLWEGHIGIQKSLNEGALFGMGQGKVWMFACFSCIALAAIPTWLFRFRAAEDRWLTVALGCVTGGILGNLYDRLGLPNMKWSEFDARRGEETIYAVRDWILFQWNDQWVWPNFNIADVLLVCGAGVLLVHSFLVPQESSTEIAHSS